MHRSPAQCTAARYSLLQRRVSGTKEDVEERLIGLGQPAGISRVLYAFLPMTVVAIVRGIERDSNPKWSFRQVGATRLDCEELGYSRTSTLRLSHRATRSRCADGSRASTWPL